MTTDDQLQRDTERGLLRLPGLAAMYGVLRAWQRECMPRFYPQPVLVRIDEKPRRSGKAGQSRRDRA